MIHSDLEVALNNQVREELESYYLYLSMSAYYESLDLPGFAGWMYFQAQEEMGHAMRIYAFVNERGGRVKLQALKEPKHEWSSVLDAFEAAYKHELYISSCIHKIVKLSREKNDLPVEVFMQWFVTEQVEEEAAADQIVKKLKRVGTNAEGLYLLDQELSARGTGPTSRPAEAGA